MQIVMTFATESSIRKLRTWTITIVGGGLTQTLQQKKKLLGIEGAVAEMVKSWPIPPKLHQGLTSGVNRYTIGG